MKSGAKTLLRQMKVMKKSKRGEGCSEYEGTGEDLEEVKQ